MSLGFSNISFPNEVTVDKLGDYYNAANHYNNAPTASLSVSQSFASSMAKGSGTATSAYANNGNIAFCFEGTSTVTIVEGLGGTETQVSLPTGADSWRGMIYDPQNDEFVIFADRVSLINATTFATRQMSNIYPNGAQVWGGTVVDGKVYVGPYTATNTYIGKGRSEDLQLLN
jgi:streptogramin lyase